MEVRSSVFPAAPTHTSASPSFFSRFVSRISPFSFVSRISPFSIDYERLAGSLKPMITDALTSGIDAMTRGLKEASSEFAHIFNDGLRDGMVILKDSLEQGIGGAVEVGIGHMNEALKEGGELQTRLNGFVRRTLQRNLCISGTILVITIGGSTFIYYGTRTGWRLVERNLMRPKLIIASSKKTLLQRMRERLLLKHGPPASLAEMICSKDLEERLNDIVRATRNIYAKTNAGATNVKYRNLMLWGPPGTGKTMFAKRLARESGLEWAYMSGSSFAKFKDGEGIEALDELFAWANRSKGLMLFIDEAEVFLAQREQMDSTSKAYQLLTNFLNYTGERSGKFMLVFATNHKHMIDSAMHRRIDDLIEIPLPKIPERFRVLALYRNKILFDQRQNGALFVNSARLCMDDTKLQEIAEQTEGLSNGDLEGIINIIKTDADITDTGLITIQVVDRAVEHALEKYAAFRTVVGSRKLRIDDWLDA
jgi:hypothetical protein